MSTAEVSAKEVEAETITPAYSDPTPLAFAAVGLPFGVISLTFTGVLSPDVSVVALPLALVYGTLGLLIAGIVAFRNQDAFGAFTYSSFSAFFLSYAAIPILLGLNFVSFQAEGQGDAFGTFVAGWTVIVTYLMLLSFRFPKVFTMVLVGLWLALTLLAVSFFAGSTTGLKIGGWVGLASSLLCLYASAALLTNTLVGRPVMRL